MNYAQRQARRRMRDLPREHDHQQPNDYPVRHLPTRSAPSHALAGATPGRNILGYK